MLHIYVISLERDTDKRKAINETLTGFDLDFSFIDAIDGATLSENTVNLSRKKSVGTVVSRGFPATPGEIGCTLSHIKAYQQMLKKNQEWACILEDDVILDERFKVFIDTFQSNEMNPKDLYILGGMTEISRAIVRSIKNNKCIGKQKFYKLIKSEHLIYRACCYLISSEMADTLSKLSSNEFFLADNWLYLSKSKYIDRVYLADFVNHPIDLSTSNLQKGRKEAELKKIVKKISFTQRAINSLKHRIRFGVLTVYKYIERKDKL